MILGCFSFFFIEESEYWIAVLSFPTSATVAKALVRWISTSTTSVNKHKITFLPRSGRAEIKHVGHRQQMLKQRQLFPSVCHYCYYYSYRWSSPRPKDVVPDVFQIPGVFKFLNICIRIMRHLGNRMQVSAQDSFISIYTYTHSQKVILKQYFL